MAEEPAAEERAGETALAHQPGHRVDDRLRDPGGTAGSVDARGPVAAERGARRLPTDHRGVRLTAELAREPRALRQRAERALVELAVVVEDVDEDVGHLRSRAARRARR